MKSVYAILFATALLLPTSYVSSFAGDLPVADGKALWTYVTEKNPYQGWGYWPGRFGMYEGTRPHGAHLKVFANGPALRAAREGKPMPAGAIVLKENYGKDGKTLMEVTPMYKVTGYNPDGGDWFWAKYAADGTIDKEGKVAGCINCHKAVKDKNWIFSESQ
jgi:hypothetical protein